MTEMLGLFLVGGLVLLLAVILRAASRLVEVHPANRWLSGT
jgi:hypothetical protein